MKPYSCSATLARDKCENLSSPLAESVLKLVKAICQVMIAEPQGEKQADVLLVRGDVNKLCTNTTKVLDLFSVRLDIT